MTIETAVSRLEAWAEYEEDALRRAKSFAEEEAHRNRAENYGALVTMIYNDPKLYALNNLIGMLEDIKDAHDDENANPEWLPSLIAEIPGLVAEARGKAAEQPRDRNLT